MVAPQFHHTSAVAHGNSGSFSSSSLCIRAAAVGNGSCRSSSVEFPESRGSGFKHSNYDNEKCLKKCSGVYQLYTKNSPGGFSCYFLDFGHSAPLHHSTSCPKALRCAPALPSKAPRLHHHAELCRGLRSARRPCQNICRSRKRAKTP